MSPESPPLIGPEDKHGRKSLEQLNNELLELKQKRRTTMEKARKYIATKQFVIANYYSDVANNIQKEISALKLSMQQKILNESRQVQAWAWYLIEMRNSQFAR